MRIVNAINMHFLKVVLKKYFLFNNLDYIFIESDDNLTDIVLKTKPEIVIMEDDPTNHFLKRQIAELADRYTELPHATKLIMIHEPDLSAQAPKSYPWIHNISNDRVLEELSKIIFDVTTHIESEQNALLKMENQKTVLFVDDDALMHALVTDAFSHTPYQLLHAKNGQEGYALFMRHLPSMVITDLLMPVMTGDEMCRRIKQDPIGHHIPVVILTGSQETGSMELAYNYGADDFLEKPLSPENLVNKVNEYFVNRSLKRQEKILIVDDSKMIREILKHAVLKSGMTALTANDGLEAMEIILSDSPDVVITDINMPRMNGYELVQALRTTPGFEEQKVIMISTQSSPYDIKKGEELGIVRYFIKPFDVDKVMMEVEHILIENYRIYKKEYEYMLYSIRALVQALEERDAYTKGHTDRVTHLSVRLATYMQMDSKELEKIHVAATLHDVGKIGVRDSILLKPDKLTAEEYLKIQEHTIKGVEILRHIQSLKDVLPLILLHHERWDGLGYPTAIHGIEIPIGARIIAVADAFDAMTSNRPYRKCISIEEALRVINDQAGTQFCPICAESFIKMIEEKTRLNQE